MKIARYTLIYLKDDGSLQVSRVSTGEGMLQPGAALCVIKGWPEVIGLTDEAEPAGYLVEAPNGHRSIYLPESRHRAEDAAAQRATGITKLVREV